MRFSIRIVHCALWVTAAAAGAFAQSSGPPTILYHLLPQSTYEEGCYDQCLCPILQAPLEGTFGLRILPTAGPFDTWAFEAVDFSVPPLDKEIEGSGFYARAGELNQLELDLQMDGNPAMHFSSGGFVPAGADFPDIDIVVSVNQMMSCFDYVLHIVATPAAPPHPTLTVASTVLAWTPVSGAEGYDVVCGNLQHLRSFGDLGASTDQCLGNDYAQTSMSYDLTPGEGQALWFLVRDEAGSYDSGGASQADPRDAAIDGSAPACP